MIKLIAETAWHHDGDFQFMSNLVDAIIKETRADIIKLHITLDLDEYMESGHPAYSFLKERLLTEKQWKVLVDKIIASDKDLMLLLNDKKAVDFCSDYNPTLIEIHSVCLNDIFLLEEINKTIDPTIPVVLGVGGSSIYEIESAVKYLKTNNIVLMHGFQNYPTKYEDVNFNKIRKLISLFPEYKHGYADHTAWNESKNVLITTMGTALGMEYVEKHVTTKPGEERTDWQAAIDIEKFNQISENIKLLEQCLGDGKLALNQAERNYSVFGPNKKGLVLKRDVKKGELITQEDVRFSRHPDLTDISQTDAIDSFSKKVSKDILKGSLLKKSDFE